MGTVTVMDERVDELEVRINDLERHVAELKNNCRHFQRQFELLIDHITRSDKMIQEVDFRIFKLECSSERST